MHVTTRDVVGWMLLLSVGLLSLTLTTIYCWGGLDVGGDSVDYVATARTLREGIGPHRVGTSGELIWNSHFPPGYPMAIAALAVGQPDVITAAHVLAGLTGLLSPIVLGAAALRMTRSYSVAVLCGAWLGFNGAFQGFNARLFSEGLYVLLTCVAVLLLSFAWRGRGRPAVVWTLAAGLVVGSLYLVRYSGLHLIACLAAGPVMGQLACLVRSRRTRAGHLLALSGIGGLTIVAAVASFFVAPRSAESNHAGSYVVVALATGAAVFALEVFRRCRAWDRLMLGAAMLGAAALPAICWSITNVLRDGKPTSRQWIYEPPRLDTAIQDILQDLRGWVWPEAGGPAPHLLAGLIVLCAIVAAGLAFRFVTRRPISRRTALLAWVTLASGTYPAFIYLAKTFMDNSIPFNGRMFLPMLPPTILCAVVGTWWVLRVWRGAGVRWLGPARVALGITAAVLFACSGWHTLGAARSTAESGRGYLSKTWEQSPTLALLRELPADAVIYTDAFDAVYLLLGRKAVSVPNTRIRGQNRDIPPDEVRRRAMIMVRRVRDTGGVIAMFDNRIMNRDDMRMTDEQIRRLPAVVLRQSTADANVYHVP